MKKLIYTLTIALSVVLISCGGPKRKPGSTYMPDMAYSRAYETFPELNAKHFTNEESKAGSLIYYDRKPIEGTMKRGQLGTFKFTNDSAGKAAAFGVVNPLIDSSAGAKVDLKEAERLFTIYCAICHGTDMKGQGPLVASGKWAGAAANLMDAEKFGRAKYGDGQIFHSITYGKNQMGGYGSQLSNQQRWMLVAYIRGKQDKANAAASTPAASTPAASTPAASTTVTSTTTKPPMK